jgi:Kdo2-lipid IVA lauroyltransferase/acyltransferase
MLPRLQTISRSLRRKSKDAAYKLYVKIYRAYWRRIIQPLRKANYWLIGQGAMLCIRLLRQLPPDRALDAVDRLARRCGPWFGRHRTAVGNLTMAYPEKSAAEIEAIALDMWGHMARLAAEYIFLDALFDDDPNKKGGSRIETIGDEQFIKLASEADKPHIFFTAHLGSFELLPIGCAILGTQITTLFRPPNNPYIAKYLHSTRLAKMGDLVASDSGAAFALAATLERGGNIGILVDQKFNNGISTTFFGRECDTNPILPMLARRFECDVYPSRCMRLPGNRYRIEIEKPIEFARNADGDIDIKAATQQLNDVVERWVREDPAQWMWFHKRWATGGRLRGKRGPPRSAGTGASGGKAVGQAAAKTASKR